MMMYVLCHRWLSDIQRGIQGSHAIVELVNTNKDYKPFMDLFTNWATNEKTMIFLNGGNSAQLDEFYKMVDGFKFIDGIFVKSFQEDKESLNFATTAVAILVDTSISNAIKDTRDFYKATGSMSPPVSVSINHVQIVRILASLPLA